MSLSLEIVLATQLHTRGIIYYKAMIMQMEEYREVVPQ